MNPLRPLGFDLTADIKKKALLLRPPWSVDGVGSRG